MGLKAREMPEPQRMMSSGLITLEKVRVPQYRANGGGGLPRESG